jgi:hypothetical protein
VLLLLGKGAPDLCVGVLPLGPLAPSICRPGLRSAVRAAGVGDERAQDRSIERRQSSLSGQTGGCDSGELGQQLVKHPPLPGP